jgi:glucokinase
MLQNDANACALAEWKYGAAKGFENIVFITFGTGFGAGMILNGRLYTGASDMAGEIGHIRIDENGPVGYGKSGSLEGFCSGGGIAQLARTMILEKLQMGEKVSLCKDLSKLNKIDAKTVAYAAGKGDMLAMDIYRKSGYYLGKGLSIIIDMLNPEIIVIGSIFARSVELLWPEAEEVINRECLKLTRDTCKIVPAGLGDEIGDYASLATALYRA